MSIEEHDSWPDRLSGNAHLWLARPSEWVASGGAETLLTELPDDERARLDTTRRPFPFELRLTARALLRRVLSLYADVSPAAWQFVNGEHGRPEIDHGALGAPCPPLRFNLSHSRELVGCVVTLETDCGIDVESVNRRVDPLAIARHSFTPDEIRALEAVPASDSQARRDLFFRLWTLKEALLKAHGAGIALRLDSAGFDLASGGKIGLELADSLGDAAEWQPALYAPDQEHYLALALRSGGDAIAVSAFEATPAFETHPPLDLEAIAQRR